MERDGLQKSLKVLQEEYQIVAKEAKVFHCTAVHNVFPTVNSHLMNTPRLSEKSFVLFIQYPPDEGLFLLDWCQF